jgi:hypothetical protein
MIEGQFKDYQEMVRKTFLDDASLQQIREDGALSVSSPSMAEHRDDNNYYFNSYAQNGMFD